MQACLRKYSKVKAVARVKGKQKRVFQHVQKVEGDRNGFPDSPSLCAPKRCTVSSKRFGLARCWFCFEIGLAAFQEQRTLHNWRSAHAIPYIIDSCNLIAITIAIAVEQIELR